MSKKIIAFVCIICLCLCGCGEDTDVAKEAEAVVYRLSTRNDGGRLVRESVSFTEDAILEDVIVEALNSPPEISSVERAFPEGVEIIALEISEGTARVEMNSAYSAMQGFERLLANSAIVLSLCTVDGICAVDIFCGDTAMALGLKPEYIAEADGFCGEYDKTLKLYLPNRHCSELIPRSVEVSDDGESSLGKMMLEQLLLAYETRMRNSKILSFSIENRCCTVDLSGEFYGAEPANSTEGQVLIYSIVNTLCRLPDVDEVSLSVDGLAVESYGGFRTDWPLSPDMELVNYYQEN